MMSCYLMGNSKLDKQTLILMIVLLILRMKPMTISGMSLMKTTMNHSPPVRLDLTLGMMFRLFCRMMGRSTF